MKLISPVFRWPLVIFLTIVSINLAAAEDSVDLDFANSAGSVYRNLNNDFGSVASLLIQPDGKILVGSNEMAALIGDPAMLKNVPLLRFNPDGSVDETFFADENANGEGDGIVFQGLGWPEVMALGLQSDGKIIAGGVLTGMNDDLNQHSSRNLIRINQDGRVDTTFQTAGTQQWITGNINYINHLFVEPDDKILITGGFRGVRNDELSPFTRCDGIARLHANGSLDTGFHFDITQFGVDPGLASWATVIIYQAVRDIAGNYYIVGEISGTVNGSHVFARLFPDGQRDPSFAPNIPSARWNSVALDPQGRITVTGLNDSGPSVAYRVFSNGNLDPSFTPPTEWGSPMAQPLEIDTQGRFLYTSGAQLRRRLDDGSEDPNFSATAEWINWATVPSFNLATTAPDGSIYAGGFFDRVNGVDTVKLVRFNGAPIPSGIGFAVESASILENAGTLFVPLQRLGGGVGAVSVDFSTTDGTALAGSDYGTSTGTLSWADGETGIKYLPISLIDNALEDGDKTLSLNLSNATGAPLTGSAGITITILDDEAIAEFITQPQSGNAVLGYPFEFTPQISLRGPASFQWQRDNGDGFEDIAGATSINLILANTVPTDAADYRLVITSGAGTLISDTATLTLDSPPGSVLPLSIPTLSQQIGNVLSLALDSSGTRYIMGTNGVRRLLADDSIDPSFNTSHTGLNEGIILALADDSLLIGGNFSTVNGQSRRGVAKINTDGTLDTTFNLGLNFGISALAVDSLGRIYIGGSSNNGLFRYHANGTIDATFSAPGIGTGGGFNPGAVYSINPQPDGTVLVGHRNNSVNQFARLLNNGALDPSFATLELPPTLSGSVNDSLVLPDGRIVIVGNFDGHLAVVDANGVLDPNFALSHPLNGSVLGVRLADQRLLVWGSFSEVGGLANRGFARYFLDGTLDPSVQLGGGSDSTINDLVIDTEGNYLIGGFFNNVGPAPRNRLASLVGGPPSIIFADTNPVFIENDGTVSLTVKRLGAADEAVSIDWASADGTATEGVDYIAASGTLHWPIGDNSDKIIELTLLDNSLIEPTLLFSLVFSNPSGPIVAGPSATIAILDDDTPVAFTTEPENTVVYANNELNLAANVDSPTPVSFQWFFNGAPIPGANSAEYSLPNATTSNSGSYRLRATNSEGFVDSAMVEVIILPEPAAVVDGFSFGPTLNAAPEVILPLPDGGALIGGNFSLVNGASTQRYLIRVNANGELDSAFAAVPNGSVDAAVMMPDGRIAIGGNFTQISSTAANRLALIDVDGTLDNNFAANIGLGFNGAVNAIALTPQGRLVVGGNFTAFNNSFADAYVTVLNSDGTRDPLFSSASANASITAIAVQPDGRILLGGSFSSYEAANRLVRVLPNGRRDFTFNHSLTGTQTINHIAVADNGQIYISGSINFSFQNRNLLRFDPDGSNATSILSGNSGQEVILLPSGNGDYLSVRNSASSYLFLRLGTEVDIANTFNTSVNFNNAATSIARNAQGQFWAGGNFTQYRGDSHHRVVLLNGIPPTLDIVSIPSLTSVTPGDSLTLNVEVSSIQTPTFQWHLDGVPLSDDARISGATTASLSIDDTAAADEGSYSVTVLAGNSSITSQPIPVFIAEAPRVLSTSGDVTSLAGLNLALEANVVGAAPLTYSWTQNGTPVSDGGAISGASTPRLVITNPTLANAGEYILTASNGFGSDLATITITVLPPPADRHPDFNTLTSSGNVNAILPVSGGRTLIANASGNLSGGLASSSSSSRLSLVAADRTISSPLASIDGVINSMVLAPDDRIILSGTFNQINGLSTPGLARLNPDFSVDQTFAPTTPPAGLSALAVDSQGRVLIGGNFTDYLEPGNDYLVRLLDDGSIDPNFSAAVLKEVKAIKPLDQDRLLVGSSTVGFLPSNHYAGMLDADGSLLTSFHNGGVNIVETDAQGRFYLGLVGSPRISRYLADGALDDDFANQVFGVGLTNSVFEMKVQQNGRIILYGNFVAPNNRIVRLNPDGSRDLSFAPGTGLSTNSSYALALDAFGKIWIGGSFSTYQSSGPARIAVLNGDITDLAFVSQPLAAEVDPGDGATFSVEATGTSPISYQWYRDGVILNDNANISGATTATLSISSVTATDEGFYSVEISNDSGALESRPVELYLLNQPEFLSSPAGGDFEIGDTLVLAPAIRGASPLTFQWLRDGIALSDDTIFSGTSTAALTIADPREANGGMFTLQVSNSLGSDSIDIPVTFFRNPARIDPDIAALSSLSSSLRDLIILPDGTRILGGNFANLGHAGGTSSIRGLAFIDPSGLASTDSVQVFRTTSAADVSSLALDSQGRLYVGGNFTSVRQGTGSATSAGRLIRAVYNDELDRWEQDTSFAVGTGASNFVSRIAVDEQDRLLVAGSFTSFNNDNNQQYLTRLLPDGSIDPDFSATLSSAVNQLIQLPDTRILVSGSNYFTRLLADGSPDLTFDPEYPTSVNAIEHFPDGRILTARGTTPRLVMMDKNGSTIPEFPQTSNASNSGIGTSVIHRLPDGRILLGGVTNYAGQTLNRLAIISELGELLASPNFEAGLNGSPEFIQSDREGRLHIGGNFTTYQGNSVPRYVVLNGNSYELEILRHPIPLRLLEPGTTLVLAVDAVGSSAISYQWFQDGAPLADDSQISGSQTDSLTITNTSATSNGLYSVTVTNQSGTLESVPARVVVGAPIAVSVPSSQTALIGDTVTLTAETYGTGSLTYSWAQDGIPLDNGPDISGADSPVLNLTNLTSAAAGSYTLTVTNSFGFATSAEIDLNVIENPAGIASNFNGLTVAGSVYAILPLSDGRVLVGGNFTSISDGLNTSGANLAVVNSDGSVDPIAGLTADNSVNRITLDSVGRPLLAGAFSNVHSTARRRVARLNTDLSLDTSFDATDEFTLIAGAALDIFEEAGGSIMVTGAFSNFHTTASGAAYAIRLTSSGAHDPSFSSDATSNIHRGYPLSNGELLFVGNFTSYGGTTLGAYAVRTFADGTRNETISYEASPNFSFNPSELLNDGSLLVGSNGGIIRFNANGTRDPSFGLNGVTGALIFHQDADGNILSGGSFTTVQGVSRNRILRTDASGQPDPLFVSGTGFNNSVRAIATAADGSIWIGGDFTTYNGTSVQRLVRLNGQTPTTTTPNNPIDDFYDLYEVPANQRGDNDDPDQNGVPNLIEFLYQTNPMDPAQRPQPYLGVSPIDGNQLTILSGHPTDPDANYQIFSFEVPKNAQGLNISAEVSTDLNNFASNVAQVHEILPPLDNGLNETRRFFVTPATSDLPAAFIRLRIER